MIPSLLRLADMPPPEPELVDQPLTWVFVAFVVVAVGVGSFFLFRPGKDGPGDGEA